MGLGNVGNVSKLISRFEGLAKPKQVSIKHPRKEGEVKSTEIGKTIGPLPAAEKKLQDHQISKVNHEEPKVNGVRDTKLPSVHSEEREIRNGIEKLKKLTNTVAVKRGYITNETDQKTKQIAKPLSNLIAEKYFQASTEEERNKWASLATELTESLHNLPKLQKEIKLEQKVAQGLVHHFPASERQPTLAETLTSIAKSHNLSEEDIAKEARLIGTDNQTAMLKMTRRLMAYKQGLPSLDGQTLSIAKRMEMTGYELSIVKGVDRAFRDSIKGKTPETKVGNFTAILQKGKVKEKVIVEEKQLGEGSFKVVTLASDFFNMQSPAERGKFVLLTPKETPTQPFVKRSEAKGEEPPAMQEAKSEEPMQEASGSFVRKDDVVYEHDFSNVDKEKAPDLNDKDLTKKQMEDLLKIHASNPDIVKDLQKRIAIREKEIELVKIKDEKIKELGDKGKEIGKNLIEQEDYVREIEITKALQGPGVIKLHSVVDLANGTKSMMQEAAGFKLGCGETVIDMEGLRNLSLSNKLNDADKRKVYDLYQEAFEGVRMVHEKGFIHRDLKELNILITKDGHAVISDFGTAVMKKDDPHKENYAGTLEYSAPETAKHKEQETWNLIDEKCDVWSCGMILLNSGMIVNKSISDHPAINRFANDLKLIEPGQKRDHLDIQLLGHLGALAGLERNQKYYNPEPKDNSGKPAVETLEHLVWSATQIDPEKRPTMAEFCARFAEISARLKGAI